MVIDVKLPPEDPSPLSIPPPAYAPPEGSPDPSSNAPPQQPQQYPPPPSSSQTYSASPALLPQWQTPGTGSQSMPPDEWVGQQYRNQLFAQCARGDHDENISFGLCGIICAILLFPIGLIFLCIDTEKKCARCGIRLD